MTPRLLLDDLIAAKKRIYVKNMTDPRGQLILTIADLTTGRIVRLPIPKIALPICLNDRLTPQLIENSTDLRNYISKGVLKLVDPDEAEKIISEGDNQAIIREALALAENSTSTQALQQRTAKEEKEFTAEGEDGGPPINETVITIVQQTKDGDIKVRDRKSVV